MLMAVAAASFAEFAMSDMPDIPFAEIGPTVRMYPVHRLGLRGVQLGVFRRHKVRTPVLSTPGEIDLRAPPAEGKSHFHALEILMKMLALVGEGHDLEGGAQGYF